MVGKKLIFKTKPIQFMKIKLAILLFILAYIALTADIIFYSGFIRNHFYINPNKLIFLSAVVGTFLLFDRLNYPNINFKLISRILIFILVISIAGFLIFGFLEESNYTNYIFSKFHINYVNLVPLISFNFYLATLFLVKGWYLPNPKNFNKKSSSFLIAGIIFLLSIYLMNNSSQIISEIGKKSMYMLANPTASYDEKMYERWGFFYDYMIFVKEKTPEDAVIHLPPMHNPWQLTGNTGLVRYFLYPRTLVNLDEPYKLSDKNYDYLLISKGFYPDAGDWGHGWPKIPIDAEKCWYIDSESEKVVEYAGDYDPKDSAIKGEWGLIKVKRN